MRTGLDCGIPCERMASAFADLVVQQDMRVDVQRHGFL
jgi:hypothetical protein